MSSFMEKERIVVYICYCSCLSDLDKLFPVIRSAVFAILGMVLDQFWKIPVILDRDQLFQRKKLLLLIIALSSRAVLRR